jgi:hypothetical protein
MQKAISKWIREVRQGNSTPQGLPEEVVFRQKIGRWVEFKRQHLYFAQTLNSLINGHSSQLNLIKHAMLCQAEIEEMRPAGAEAPQGDLSLETVFWRLPLPTFSTLYRLVNSRAFSEEALDILIEGRNIKITETILVAASVRIAPCDHLFARIAEDRKFEGADRAGRHTSEITGLHNDILRFYRSALRANGVV